MRKLFVLLFLAVLPLAMSADPVEVNGLWYELNTDTSPTAVVINPQDGSHYSGDIVIPSTVSYEGVKYTVTEIGSWSFCWNDDILSVVIPSTITAIGDGAFMGCNNLAYIISNIQVAFDVPKNAFCNSDYAIGETVYYNRSSAILYVPAGSLSNYQSHAGWDLFPMIFEGERLEEKVDNLKYAYTMASSAATVIKDDYNSLEDVIIPSSVTIGGSLYSVKAIGSSAFYNCYNIHSITFNEGLETICRSAFNACWNATFGVLPSTIQHVGSEAFFSCGRIKKLIIPEGCKTIDSHAFSWCDLQKLELPSTLTRIGERAFIGSRNLDMAISHIVNPYAIQNNVFCKEEHWNENGQSYDKSDAKLYVPSGTKSAYEALDGWNMFADIIEGEPKEATVDGITYSYVEGQSAAIVVSGDYSGLENVVIPAKVNIGNASYSVKAIGASAFRECGNIRSITFNEGLETIGNSAFQSCWNTSFGDLPSTITSIGNYAFDNCNEIKKIVIPANCKSIGNNAFNWCGGLQRVEIPSSITSLGDYAFYGCDNLSAVISRIVSPSDVNISKSTFASRDYYYDESGNYVSDFIKSNATLYVPNGKKSGYEVLEGWNMFADIIEGELKEATVNGLNYSYLEGKGVATVIGRADENLNDITIPGSVTINGKAYAVRTIGVGAFYDLRLQSVTIEDGVETIEKQAFWDSDGISKLVLPSTLKTIGDEAFTYAYITDLVLPEGLISIGKSAFRSCYRIKKLELPSTLTSIGENAFYPTRNLSVVSSKIAIPFEIGQSVFCSEYSSSWDETQQKDVYTYTPSNATLYVPDGTKSAYEAIAGWNMFADIVEGELKEATVDGLTYSYLVGKGSATVISGDYSEMKEVTIPGSVTIDGSRYNVKEIGADAFRSCSIETLVVQNGVDVIGEGAFRYNYSLHSVSLPTSLRTICKEAFYNCRIDTLVVPEGVETIGERAFSYQWSSLKSVTFPSTLRSIGREAFRSCTGIQKLELLASLTSIDEFAFAGMDNLSSVTSRITNPFEISESVFCSEWSSTYDEDQQKEVFTYTPSKANLYVPDGTLAKYQAIPGWKIFANIIEGELKEAKVGNLNYSYLVGKGNATVISGDYSELHNVTILGTVTIDGSKYTVKEIGAGAFRDCNSLDTLVIETGVETIGKYAFAYCHHLKSISIPEGVKTIGEYAFQSCGSWSGGKQKLTLPSTLTSIGEYAFSEMSYLSIVTSKIKTPFEIGQNVFCRGWYWEENDVQVFNKSSATLYVPDGTKSAYEAIAGWNMFADIVEGELKEATVDGLTYSYLVGKGNATVISGDYSEMKEVTIPGSVTIDGSSYTVKEIGADAFRNCSIETLVVQNGVDVIGEGAFRYNYSLHSVSLPTSLRTICREAFYNCRIGSLVVPKGVETIGERAFSYQWSSMKSVTFPSTLRTIGREAFISCTGIQKLELPASLTSIDEFAFAGMDNLSSVTSRITDPFEISESVFCTEWSSTYDEGQQKEIFTYTPSKANLYVPDGTLAKYQAFSGWKMFAGMFEGELQEQVVGDLKYAYLPSTLTATVVAGDYSELRNVTVPGTVTIDGTTYQVKEIGAGAFRDNWQLESVIIQNGVETIGKEAFRWCGNATFSALPSSLRTIEQNAFNNCNNIKILDLPEGLLTIGNNAFIYCYGLQKVILPSTLTSIGESAFASNNNLSVVVSHIQPPFAISANVFGNEEWNSETQSYDYTPSAATLYVPEGTTAKYQALEGWMMFANMFEGELIEYSDGTLSYTFNNSSKIATVIKGENYNKLTKVTVPATITVDGVTSKVKTISARAFSGTPVTSVEMVDGGVEKIEQEAFQSCSQLTSISLPSSLTTIDDGAFRDCNHLTSVTIPASVISIGQSLFSGCQQLKSIVVADGNMVYESRNSNAIIESSTNTLIAACETTVIPNSVTAIGREAFVNLGIKEIQIPGSVKVIGENAFNSCHNLTEVFFPEGLETISSTAFFACSNLNLIEFPNSLKEIEGWAFGDCNNLLTVVSNIEAPKALNPDVFGENSNVYSRATLWVPKGKVQTYKATEGWNRFERFDSLLYENLAAPAVKYDGRHLSMTIPEEQHAQIYYSLDGSKPSILYSDTLTLSSLVTVNAIARRFGSYTVDTTRYVVDYLYDDVTAHTASGGLLSKAFEWSGTDKIEILEINGTLNDEDFATIRSMSKLRTLNMSAVKLANGAIPAEAFANTNLQWFISPYSMTSVGSNIFKGCQQLSAITWNSSTTELPQDVATDVANPNMLVYAKAQAMIPYALKNVIINGVANNIILADSEGNCDFRCPVEFTARRISYTHNYQQLTARGVTQGWETLALPFTVTKITHETKGEITPSSVEGAQKPFWLYELGDNGLEKATQIRAHVPYLICMPNNDAYGDEYILGGRVTFSANNVVISTSGGTAVSQGNRQFVPTYQRVAKANNVYALNIGEAYGGNPVGSVFVADYRDVRPFEAYSVHGSSRARIISINDLGSGDATGIFDWMLKDDGESADAEVKVYTLSGSLIKQGRREEVLRSLPKGLYIINGKKVIK